MPASSPPSPSSRSSPPSTSSTTSDQADQLLAWYSALRAPTVDLVGDIAGREPFLIHGESLLRHCLQQSEVNFKDGFQVLHAAYAVEKFLENLHKRGCDFDVVFFNRLRFLCAPPMDADVDTSISAQYVCKNQLARTVIIKHLQRHARAAAETGARAGVLEFEGPEDEAFERYLESLPVHFVMCHAGEEGNLDTVQLRRIIYGFVSSGKNVAILNSVEWKSSKVYAPLIARSSEQLASLDIEEYDWPDTSPDWHVDIPPELDLGSGLSARELLGISACVSVRSLYRPEDEVNLEQVDERIQAYLLHLAVLKDCTLLERQDWMDLDAKTGLLPEDDKFLTQVIEASLVLIQGNGNPFDGNENSEWDLYDPVDGFVFSFGLPKLRRRQPLPAQILYSWTTLWRAFSGLISPMPPTLPDIEELQEWDMSSTAPVEVPSALPFNHKVFDEFLGGIKLKEREETRDDAADLVFKDLHHWHSTKLLKPAGKPKVPDFFMRRRKQRLLADILTYSASLTNARGKLIDPEVIVVKRPQPNQQKRERLQKNEDAKLKVKEGKAPARGKKGGKADALKAAQEVQRRKDTARHAGVISHWEASCREIEKDQSLVSRYLRTTRFLNERNRDDLQTIGPDVQLYLAHVLGKIWAQNPPRGLYIIALMWDRMQKMAATPASKAVAQAFQELVSRLEMPGLPPLLVGSQTHALCFRPDFKTVKGVPATIHRSREFQLQHAGPYMERRFDSRPDPRVPFEPDAWQRRVLDSIDANHSLLVVAPTSAGKTFISFYAMKQVLEASDDGVLVYVAPTKPLVNQIAAEVGARFSKSYHPFGEGKSVWAISTRDYRVQSAEGCQILVTVPHMLQIMLLSPANANEKGPSANAWSRRIKRIIFDEVHCIGQAEDGVVWEQLLLMAPCPVIALSATVGNPLEFRDWLALVQERKGLKLDMVVHTARYSDLRKFIYEPAASPRRFVGFDHQRKRIAVPGLDEGDDNKSCPNFHFVHPIATLTDRNRTALSHLSLEPRDCLSLWKAMKQVLSPEEMAEFDVPPVESLPSVITKSDVSQWEIKLKSSLQSMMESRSSLFHKICDALKPSKGSQGSIRADKASGASSLFDLILDLHDRDSLPVLVFHYDIHGCESTVEALLGELVSAEEKWKSTSPEWASKLKQFDQFQKAREKTRARSAPRSNAKDKSGDGNDRSAGSKLDQVREEANLEHSPWERFDPSVPLEQFNLADASKLLPSEVQHLVEPLHGLVPDWMPAALRRGLGVHHSGLNRKYRQTVEIMFRKGFLRAVVATGTLALGINMPCKTVVFHQDSIFLTAQNYQQAAGRAGRRGFDLLGNVVFHDIPPVRALEIVAARLPALTGQFPLSTTLVLRLLTLLHGSDCSELATRMVQSLLSQTRLYLGGPDAKLSVKHHLRFSIEYLRRQKLLGPDGAPINFAGLVCHLYFTENGVFAFHSLLRGGYFHRLCAHITTAPDRVMLEILLVLSHLFNRVPASARSSTRRLLPPLPPAAEALLLEHNESTLSIFHAYVQSYIFHSLAHSRDNILPYTHTAVGPSSPRGAGLSPEPARSHAVRSPFVALSRGTSAFRSIRDLCETVRSGVFLEESAIPHIPVGEPLNAYIYDFWRHGSLAALVRENGIRRGDVWFFLRDFSRTLSAIVASLAVLIGRDAEAENSEAVPEEEYQETLDEEKEEAKKEKADRAKEAPKKQKKDSVIEDWIDDDIQSDEESSAPEEWEDEDAGFCTDARQQGGLDTTFKAFTMLRDEFDEKFRKTWA